jgi:hypothetical protein
MLFLVSRAKPYLRGEGLPLDLLAVTN